MFEVAVPARRIRRRAGAAAAVLASLAVAAIAVPLVQHSATLASATQLQDGTLAAAGLGSMGGLPEGAPLPPTDAPTASAAGVAAFGDGATVSVTRFDGASSPGSTEPTGSTESTVELGDEARDLSLSPGGDLLAVVDASGTLSLIDIAAPVATELAAADLGVSDVAEATVAISADGSVVAAAVSAAQQILLLGRDGGQVREVDVGLPVSELASGPSSRVYALADAALVVVDAAGGSIVRSVAAPTSGTTGLALVDGGESLAIWSDERLLLLDPISLDADAAYDPTAPVFGVADGPAAGTLMVGLGGEAPRIALVELASGATLSEIAIDERLGAMPSPPAIGAASEDGSLFLATPVGAVTGSWDASRVPWPLWWAGAALLALLAAVFAIVALSADRLGARAQRRALAALRAEAERRPRTTPQPEVDAVPALAPPAAESEAPVETPAPAMSPPSEARAGTVVAKRPVAPVAPAGRIQDRMSALGFAITVPADAQRVIELVRTEAERGSDGATELRIDKVFDEGAVTGSVHSSGERTATFVLWLDPVPSGGTRANFRVEWYAATRPTTLSIPVGPKDSVAYGPLRDFASRLAGRLEEEQA
ncbi:hypothetical protein [Agrococcus sp. DT81.2]|uniref:hypothetical protein n=1 Tax=Agrococcus sp. DT81.2 TaxID=3393414 RepID=UPI003CE54567